MKMRAENKALMYLLEIRYEAHRVYYVFTKNPYKLFKTGKSRWGYLDDVDFDKTGFTFTDQRYERRYTVHREVYSQIA